MKKEKIKKKRHVSEREREELYNEYEYDNGSVWIELIVAEN